MAIHRQPAWLYASFYLATGITLVIVGVAMARETRRPVHIDQRIVLDLGVIDRCETCHEESKHPGAWLSSHPTERFACTPCHGGQGLSTTRSDAHEAKPDWERPLYTALERQAACGRCHQEPSVEGAALLAKGRIAMVERGCSGCHEISGVAPTPIGPELDGLRHKVKPAWVRAWLTNPPDLYPNRLMPHFRLDHDQIEALTAFLLSVDGPALRLIPAEPEGNADRGKKAVAARRCATCHVVEGRGGRFAISLDVAGVKIEPDWLFNYLTDTHRIRPGTRMPGFRIPDAEAADIVAYAAEQWVPDSDQSPWATFEKDHELDSRLIPAGRKLFSDLGCRGCHGITSVPLTLAGVALTGIGDRRVGEQPVSPTLPKAPDMPSWIAQKVKSPDAFDKPGQFRALMPAYKLEQEEAEAIGVAIAAIRVNRFPATYVRSGPDAAAVLPSGGPTRQLVERFQCLVCHRINGVGGDVSRVPLDGEAARVERPWLEGFLQAPVTIRMDQAERMPVMGIAPSEAARLANWIEASLADDRLVTAAPFTDAEVQEGKVRYTERECAKCHVAEGKGTMKGPVLDGARERLTPAYLIAMLQRGAEVVPARRHPDGVYSEAESRAMAAYVYSLPRPAAVIPTAPAPSPEPSPTR